MKPYYISNTNTNKLHFKKSLKVSNRIYSCSFCNQELTLASNRKFLEQSKYIIYQLLSYLVSCCALQSLQHFINTDSCMPRLENERVVLAITIDRLHIHAHMQLLEQLMQNISHTFTAKKHYILQL